MESFESFLGMKVVLIGAGNVATHLSTALRKAGYRILQVYSRSIESAKTLAQNLNCSFTIDYSEIREDADFYIFALKDDALPDAIAGITPNDGLWIHTSGSVPIDVFKGYAKRYGVMYPLQTFSKERYQDFNNVPIFVEGVGEDEEFAVHQIASSISSCVSFLSSEKRKYLHLAAVFACNFTNHLYSLAWDILEKQDINPSVLLPLIDETAAKVHVMRPDTAQTGPAVRFDTNIIAKHLSMLDDKLSEDIYNLISESIHYKAITKQ